MPQPRRLAIVLFLGVACLLGSTAARAQGGPPPNMSGQQRHGTPTPGMQLDRIAERLEAGGVPLSNTQQTSILLVLLDAQTAAKTAQASTVFASDQAARAQQLQALATSVHASIRALLTTAQAAIYDTRPAQSDSQPPM